jgi:UPF0755 protein
VTRPPALTTALAVYLRVDRSLRPGRYAFVPGTPPVLVLETLTRGPNVRPIRVTLPEGWIAGQIARRLEERGVIEDAKRFLRLCNDPTFLDTLDLPTSSAEGFLFPDTYLFEPLTDEREVIRLMVSRFEEVIRSLGLRPGLNSPRAYGLNFLESATLASIIEREAADPNEMPLIGSVYHNRLRRKMRLESCATVRHALDKWHAPLTISDLKVESPFNTYLVRGLPPTPICNPGRAALDAAFRPAKSDFLYYVYRGDSTHTFSRTLKEHQRARRKHREAWKFSAERLEED